MCLLCGQDGCSCGFTTAEDASGSLIESLTCCVDCIRDIQTQLGARPYEVHLVWIKWSGGERGVGSEYVERDEMVLPTPLVRDLSQIRRETIPIGSEEVGGIRVSEISPRYSDPLLEKGTLDGVPLARDQSFFWEVVSPPKDGAPRVRRRFMPKSAPHFQADNFEWYIDLIRAGPDRTEEGYPNDS